MYIKLMALNASKKVPIQRVMAFENSPVALTLFKDDGTSVTSEKSAFLHKLKKLLPGPSLTDINSCDCFINDGNALSLIQSLSPPVPLERITLEIWLTNS